METSQNVARLRPSATIAVATRAKELRAAGRHIINLSQGEPDFDTPGFVAEAGIAAIRDGQTRYTPAPGMPELRAAIARVMQGATGSPVDAAGIVVSTGAKQALFNACFTLFGPGDRVLLPAPYWTSYPEIIRLARAEPVEVHGDQDRGFKVSPDALDRATDESVRGLILNSPSNPTGAVYDRDELDAIVRWANDRGLWVISDEIYGRICYTADRAAGVLDLDPALHDRVVVIDGVSKVFAMTGWRIGYSYSRADLAAKISALQSHTTSNPNTPAQHAALAAYGAEPLERDAVRSMVRTFEARRDRVLELFTERLPSLAYVQPEGAFYLFFRVDSLFDAERPDAVALCTWLLEEAGVALVPGDAFGDGRYVRLSFAASEATLSDGIERLANAIGARAAAG